MTDTEILEKAAKLIEQGWTQGSYAVQTDTGALYCMLGALAAASEVSELSELSPLAVERLVKVIDLDSMGWISRIAEFNDSSRTSKEDVLLVFKKAIYEYES